MILTQLPIFKLALFILQAFLPDNFIPKAIGRKEFYPRSRSRKTLDQPVHSLATSATIKKIAAPRLVLCHHLILWLRVFHPPARNSSYSRYF